MMPVRIEVAITGLAAGLILGVLLFGITPAHGQNSLILNDARPPKDIIHMTVADIILEYDQALNTYGAEGGLKFKEMINAYLLGIETGLFVDNSIRIKQRGETGFFCLAELMTGGQLVNFLKDRVRRTPKFANNPYQVALASALSAAYPCRGS